MIESKDIVIGIDGGGTHTRVMVSDLSGNVLAYVEKGAASFHKDIQAKQNVKQAILEALLAAEREIGHVRAIAAGIAGYDSEADLEWVEQLTEIDGLACPRWHVNDAAVAHYGALMAQPGIVVISGTGSIIFGVTEEGRYIRNYDFHHYAASAARFIAYDAAFEALAGFTDETDSGLVHSMLEHWQADSLNQFNAIARSGFARDRRERDRMFGQFAPVITEAAVRGSSLAKRVCDRAIQQIMVGIHLLAASFSGDVVRVAFIGSVAKSEYFNNQLSGQLISGNHKHFQIVQPLFSPVTGAILFAMNRLNINIDEAVVGNLRKHRCTLP
ncbi:BadF/BadG/BcrA/BcrD ATPase family protein [Paenibacillus tarimensis]